MPGKRRFTDEQKLEILQQAAKFGISAVLREQRLSYSVFAKWREKFSQGNNSNNDAMLSQKTRSELKQFMEENVRLKKIIADQALELERKDEELKKTIRYMENGKFKNIIYSSFKILMK